MASPVMSVREKEQERGTKYEEESTEGGGTAKGWGDWYDTYLWTGSRLSSDVTFTLFIFWFLGMGWCWGVGGLVIVVSGK